MAGIENTDGSNPEIRADGDILSACEIEIKRLNTCSQASRSKVRTAFPSSNERHVNGGR